MRRGSTQYVQLAGEPFSLLVISPFCNFPENHYDFDVKTSLLYNLHMLDLQTLRKCRLS